MGLLALYFKFRQRYSHQALNIVYFGGVFFHRVWLALALGDLEAKPEFVQARATLTPIHL